MLEEIVRKISSLQSTGDRNYQAGLFPSQRVYPTSGYQRQDNNIFFSALIVFTLNQLGSALPSNSQSIIEGIVGKVIPNYPRYRHYADKTTYNFWQNRRFGHFPNGFLLRYLNFMALPADIDDTSLIYLTDKRIHDAEAFKTKVSSHYPPQAPLSNITPHDYRDLRPYPTFLGKQMRHEIDVCVLCNFLFLIFKANLKLTHMDHDSIRFIQLALSRKDYLKSPFEIAPNYNNPAVILYHMARLLGSNNHVELEALQKPLISALIEEDQKSRVFMESLLIRSSLLRLGINRPRLSLPDNWKHQFNNFFFFQAGMLSAFQIKLLHPLAGNRLFHLKYRCEAYYWTLWLEYNVLLQQINPDHQEQY